MMIRHDVMVIGHDVMVIGHDAMVIGHDVMVNSIWKVMALSNETVCFSPYCSLNRVMKPWRNSLRTKK